MDATTNVMAGIRLDNALAAEAEAKYMPSY